MLCFLGHDNLAAVMHAVIDDFQGGLKNKPDVLSLTYCKTDNWQNTSQIDSFSTSAFMPWAYTLLPSSLLWTVPLTSSLISVHPVWLPPSRWWWSWWRWQTIWWWWWWWWQWWRQIRDDGGGDDSGDGDLVLNTFWVLFLLRLHDSLMSSEISDSHLSLIFPNCSLSIDLPFPNLPCNAHYF